MQLYVVMSMFWPTKFHSVIISILEPGHILLLSVLALQRKLMANESLMATLPLTHLVGKPRVLRAASQIGFVIIAKSQDI